MPSLLCISADPELASKIESLAKDFNIRHRIVGSQESAEEWLSMQQFDIFLVDSTTLDTKTTLHTLSLAWKHHPSMHSGVLSFSRPYKDKFDVILVGAEVYEEFSKLQALFAAQPSKMALGESSYYGVLVVEDLDSPRDIICAYIESLGHPEVKGVSSVAEAIEELEKNPYEYFCIVSDLKMPKQNGIELIVFVRAHDLLKPLPLVILTSAPSHDNLVDCIRAGATGFLAKPPKKLHLQKELERAKRILRAKASPRLCAPEDAELVEEAIRRSRLL